MAAAYGRVTGPGTSATRTGTHASGITATVQTWDGALTLHLDTDGTWTLHQHAPERHAPHCRRGEPIATGHLDTPAPVRVVGEEPGHFSSTVLDGATVVPGVVPASHPTAERVGVTEPEGHALILADERGGAVAVLGAPALLAMLCHDARQAARHALDDQ